MNEKPPFATSSSLIERASEIYGLREAMRSGGDNTPAPASSRERAKPVADRPVFDRVAEAAQPASAPVDRGSAQPTAVIQTSRAPLQSGLIDLVALGESGFIVPGAPPSPLSEEFRLVKRQLLLSAFGGRNTPAVDKGRLILMCSAQPNEGKTFCSVNLALSMAAETEIEVLLVDADVAKPEILSTLGLAGGRGLMDALADPGIDAEDLIIGTNVPGLSVLPAGRQSNNDTELLASDRTPYLIDQLAARHPRRIILFDSAPALAASPASVLALHVGQIMLVVRADQTSEGELREALAMLEGNARIQMVLNGVSFGGSTRKYGYYYGFGEKS